MGRILCIDYGRRRCGIAVTDVLRISANGLPTIRTHELMTFLNDYCRREPVDTIIIGYPTTTLGQESESMRYIKPFVAQLRKTMPQMTIEYYDERFTSTIAHREILAGGVKKHNRQQKGLADEVAAVIILTDYLQHINPL